MELDRALAVPDVVKSEWAKLMSVGCSGTDKDILCYICTDGTTLRNDHAVGHVLEESNDSGHIGLVVDTNLLTITLGTADNTIGKKDSKK